MRSRRSDAYINVSLHPANAYERCRYHWSLILAPKDIANSTATALRFHAKTVPPTAGTVSTTTRSWAYEEAPTSLAPENMLLVRVAVAKVASTNALRKVVEGIPVGGDESFNCVSWVRSALEALFADGAAVGRVTEWEKLREAAMWYAGEKRKARRFDGIGEGDVSKVPTWDLMESKELIP